jgi:N-acetylgalactosamine-N,N'-diacetylbacillosaminyl-diphospho-undecaprenol 4-alpha-N-acetylgalactosaminyltransferase
MQKMKICLIGNSLSNGGANKIHAVLSNYFFEQNFEVHNVIFIDNVTFPFSGSLLNLSTSKRYHWKYIHLLERFWTLKRFLKINNFDFIIDFRNRNHDFQEFIFTKFLYKTPFIITAHSYNLEWYFPKNRFLAKSIFSKAFGIVAVSNEIEQKIKKDYGYKNVFTIYNPLELEKIELLSEEIINLDFEFVLGVGRMVFDNNKQFDLMIEAYSLSDLPKKNIKLVLLGDGEQRKDLENLVFNKNLKNKVVFLGFQNNPFPYFKNAKFTILTSKNEGLPNTITESLACKTPVISFDCLSGPKELILDRINGLLIENQNLQKFVFGINELINDENLYSNCKNNAQKSVEKFAMDIIGNQWLNYLKKK